MCENKECTLKENCYRFTAKPSEYQYYAGFKQDEEGNCEDYWDNSENKRYEQDLIK